MPIALYPGTHPDAPDARDYRFRPSLRRLPARVDLSPDCGPCFDQRRIRSCSANAIASAMMLLANRNGTPIARPSRLFMYYNARAAAGDQRRDDGTTVRTAVKAAARFGACTESQWPYLSKSVLRKPPARCYRSAEVRTILYERISRKLDHLRACLAQGDPFVFGIQAYPIPFTHAQTSGMLELPKAGTQPMGGHALVVVGYDTKHRAFFARNSLGAKYAHNGFFWVREGYFTDPQLSYDFWRITGFEPGP